MWMEPRAAVPRWCVGDEWAWCEGEFRGWNAHTRSKEKFGHVGYVGRVGVSWVKCLYAIQGETWICWICWAGCEVYVGGGLLEGRGVGGVMKSEVSGER